MNYDNCAVGGYVYCTFMNRVSLCEPSFPALARLRRGGGASFQGPQGPHNVQDGVAKILLSEDT